MGRFARVGAALAAATLGSCLRVQYERQIVLEPLRPQDVEKLRPGQSDLGECLALLGAPKFVWERSGDSIALAYACYRDASWGFNVSYQVTEGVSPSFDYTQLDANTRGYVLLFDGEWRLESVRAGYLRDLRLETQRPPPQSLE